MPTSDTMRHSVKTLLQNLIHRVQVDGSACTSGVLTGVCKPYIYQVGKLLISMYLRHDQGI